MEIWGHFCTGCFRDVNVYKVYINDESWLFLASVKGRANLVHFSFMWRNLQQNHLMANNLQPMIILTKGLCFYKLSLPQSFPMLALPNTLTRTQCSSLQPVTDNYIFDMCWSVDRQ